MKIIVDADAAPKMVLEICRRAAADFKIALWTVANFNHNIVSDNHVVVGNSSQEADLRVMNMTAAGDVVVTQDYGLAAMVLGKGAAALSPHGKVYREETINFMLEERDMKARFRRGGGRTRGPRKRTPEDDERFQKALNSILLELAK
jgi:uncharacterized protein YaiI (UPF0178 family)